MKLKLLYSKALHLMLLTVMLLAPFSEASADDDVVYFRNTETGMYLKVGGKYGQQLVAGTYPLGFNIDSDNALYVHYAETKTTVSKNILGKETRTYTDENSYLLRNEESVYVGGNIGTKTSLKYNEQTKVISDDNGALQINNNSQNSPNGGKYVVEYVQKDESSVYQQWEKLTAAELESKMANATFNNPVNVSYLIDNPNFDFYVDLNETSKWTLTKYHSSGTSGFDHTNRFGTVQRSGVLDGKVDDNPCYEVCVDKQNSALYEKDSWTMSQPISGVRKGYYRVSFQGFQSIYRQENNKNKYIIYEDDDVKKIFDNTFLYVNDKSNKLKVVNVFDVQGETDGTLGGFTLTSNNVWEKSIDAPHQGKYYPGDVKSASKYFQKGYFHHSMVVYVDGNTMTIGIDKAGTVGNDHGIWVCFDNFQLEYLGEKNAVYLDNETKPEEARSWKMTGNWYSSDMAGLQTTLESKYTSGTYEALVLDATEANLEETVNIPIPANAPNLIIKTTSEKRASIANTQNVMVNNVVEDLVITDKKDFRPFTDNDETKTFTANKVTYTRTNTIGYNTVCMPFPIVVGTTFPSCTVYKYNGITEDEVSFVKVDNGETIAAGVPVLVYSPDNTAWNVTLNSTTECEGLAQEAMDEQDNGLRGTFMKTYIGTDENVEHYYKMNNAGDAFVRCNDTSNSHPFRFYLVDMTTTTNSVKAFSLTADEDETDIENILNESSDRVHETYDLNGRRVISILRPGVYVKNGKKIINK